MANQFAGYPGVVTRSDRVGGKPTLGESRVPAELVADCLDDGDQPEEIAYNYSLPLELVREFKTYRNSHQPAVR